MATPETTTRLYVEYGGHLDQDFDAEITRIVGVDREESGSFLGDHPTRDLSFELKESRRAIEIAKTLARMDRITAVVLETRQTTTFK